MGCFVRYTFLMSNLRTQLVLVFCLFLLGCGTLGPYGEPCPDGSSPGKNGCDDLDTADYDTSPTDTDDTDDTDDTSTPTDADNDGYTVAQGDCDDTRSDIHPGATDTVGNGTDENCDGIDGVDGDSDGYASIASGGDDCDDAPNVYPGATETDGDNVDSNCDGADGVCG